MKHRSQAKRLREIRRGLVAITIALGCLLPVSAQRPSPPQTDTPHGIDRAISLRLNEGLDRRPKRAVTRFPNDIEKALGSIAGSMAGANSSMPAASQQSVIGTGPGRTASVSPAADVQHAAPQAISTTTKNSVNIPAPISHGPMAGQLDTYRTRALELEDGEPSGGIMVTDEQMELKTWWQEIVTAPFGLSTESMPVDIASLTETALASSPYVQGILTEPEIRRSDLVIADSEFDSLAFFEAKYADTNEPIGDQLTTGFTDGRFRDETLSSALGVRRKSRYGASLEVVQRSGYQQNNSTFLDPNPQGTTRLEINFTQPLLKDRGRAVNNTRVLLAKIDVQLANSEVRSDLEDHLIDVTRAYWDLYQARADWLQRNRLLNGATKLADILQGRGEVDSLQRQILRAQVAVTSRRSDLVRAEARIRNAQAQLRLLTGDPRLIQATRWELTPADRPLTAAVQVSTRQATITALDNRPDVAGAIRKVQAVSARVGAAKNQVLPRLDLILSTYVAGLDSRRDTWGAFVNQFGDGRPSYAAGIQFEIPIGNRASRARLNRNRWELSRALYDFQQTTEVAFTDVEIAVRETETAFGEMVTKQQAVEAAGREVSYLQQRWEQLPDPNESAVLLIEDLLDAQERLADEERALVRAQVDYAMSWVRLRKAMGVLLTFDNLDGPPPGLQRQGGAPDGDQARTARQRASQPTDVPGAGLR